MGVDSLDWRDRANRFGRGFFVLVGCGVFAIACTATSTTEPIADLGIVGQVPELEAFGSLVGLESDPLSTSFDAVSRSFDFAPDASVVVPEGAFGEQTVVTASTVTLDFHRFLSNAPNGALYVVGTAEEVALGTPVFLEVARPADSVNVIQLRDGQWQPIPIEPGATTRVPIEHFSTVVTAVVDVPGKATAALTNLPGGDSPAGYLSTCLRAMTPMLTRGADDISDADFGINLALSLCTNALIDQISPDGRRAPTACVGDTIGGDIDIQEAVNLCAGLPPSQPTNDDQPEPAAPVAPVEELVAGARYQGDLAGVVGPTMQESLIEVVISPEGQVTGRLTGREELTREFFDFCGLLDDADEADECPPLKTCPMTQLWDSDLSVLRFEGDPPDRGTVSGTLIITWTTLETDCIEPAIDTNPIEIQATVRPDDAVITTPFEIPLTRVPE